ncbi:carcinine hydrolase/isopenicillin-N N-acyltransferase family protein [Photobacterium sanguinicancri]|uniref:carcinine hydrolase/isopenicillin-N N-acyltransferase family protein n=1 Tax=Photobacterium sanguinicancri TaxID=875932 RepID=UPI003D0C288A
MKSFSILTLALAVSSSVFAAPNGGVAKDLPFFNGERASFQKALNVIDLSDKKLSEAGLDIAKLQSANTSFEGISVATYKKAEMALNNARIYMPEYVEMLRVQAQERNIHLVDLIAKSIHFDLSLDSEIVANVKQKLEKGCTTMAFNNGIVGQTIDLPYSLIDSETTWVKTQNFIGLVEDGVIYQGMGRHVGLAINHLGEISYPNTDNDKIVSADMFFYAASQKNNVEEVIELAQQIRTPIAYNFTVADDKGGYAAINVSGDKIVVHRGTEKGVAHTNHIESATEKYIQSPKDYTQVNQKMGWTFARKEAADFFIKYTPELTVEAMQYAFTQRPINLTAYEGDQFVTVTSYVLDMKKGCAYVAPENPRFTDYTQVCFD